MPVSAVRVAREVFIAMKCISVLLRTVSTAILLAVMLLSGVAMAEEQRSEPAAAEEKKAQTEDKQDPAEPVKPEASVSDVSASPEESARLQYVMEYAQNAYARINKEITDYTCIVAKRERVDGRLTSYQYMYVKIRHAQNEDDATKVPFSVFLRFLEPEKMKGREVLFIEDRNNGDLIARRGGRRSPNMTVQLVPTSPLAMEGNRYPITEIGFQNLAKRLIEVLEEELEYNDGEVKIYPNAKVDGRKVTHFRLTHHQRRPNLRYHMAEVSVDDELKIPIYYRAFDWPLEEGQPPRLLEEYSYKQVKLNVGLTDSDFDLANPEYHFNLRQTDVADSTEEPPAETGKDESTEQGGA